MKSTSLIMILTLLGVNIRNIAIAATMIPVPGNPAVSWDTPIVRASPGSLAKSAGNKADSEARWGKSVFIEKPFRISSSLPAGTYYQLKAYHEVYARPRFEGLDAGMDAMVEITNYPGFEPEGVPEEGYVFHDLPFGGRDHRGTDLICLETGKTYYMKVFSTVSDDEAFKEHYTGALIQLAEPEPLSADFIADSLDWVSKKGVEYKLRVARAELFKQTPPAEALAGLFWARGPNVTDVLEGNPIVTAKLFIGDPPGRNPVIGIAGTDFLKSRPAGASHFVLVADVGNRFIEAIENNNAVSMPIPPDFSAEYLKFDDSTGGLQYKFSATGLEPFRGTAKEVTWNLSYLIGTFKGPPVVTKVIRLGNERVESELSGVIKPEDWQRVPFDATRLVLEIDPEDRIPELDETNNRVTYGVPPWLMFQPVIVLNNPDVNFSVVAYGTPPLRYQWRKDGQDLFGVNTAAFVIRNVQPESSGIYAVRVENDYGWTISSNVILNVALNPMIAVSAMPSSGGTVSGGGSYPTESSRTVTAAASEGYSFVNWTENGSVVSTSASYTFILKANRTLVANFSPKPPPPPVKYTLTVSASPSAGGKVTGGGTFDEGSSATVAAAPNNGYTFLHWSENGAFVSASATYTLTLNGNRTLVARFSGSAAIPVKYTLTLSASPSLGGTVIGGGTFDGGSSRTVTATANSGYAFANWSENGAVVSSSLDYTFALNKNRTLVANFVTKAAPVPPSTRSDLTQKILFQDAAGSVAAWLMNGASKESVSLFDPSNPGDGWRACGLGDFDRDGKEDLLFQHKDGSLAVWFLDGFKMQSAAFLVPRSSGPSWRAIGVGDFDRDGNPDIAFQHADGSLAVWLLAGTRAVKGSYFEPQSPGESRWRLKGNGDLDGDGNSDLVFQHPDGAVAIWFLDGLWMTRASLTTPSHAGEWEVSAVTDLNKDGRADLMFQNFRTSELAVWFMEGSRAIDAKLLNPSKAGGTWKIVGPR